DPGKRGYQIKPESLIKVGFVVRAFQRLYFLQCKPRSGLVEQIAYCRRDLHAATRAHKVVGFRSDQEAVKKSRNGNLWIGHIDLGQNRLSKLGLDHIRGYADDGVRLAHAGIFSAQIKLLSQRALASKVASRESFINERDIGTARGVGCGDRASLNHGNPHYLCEPRANGAHEGMILWRLLFWAPDDVDGAVHVDALKWHRIRVRSRFHSRQLLNLLQERFIDTRRDGVCLLRFCRRFRHSGKEAGGIFWQGEKLRNIRFIEAEIDVLKFVQRAKHQSAGNEQDYRQGNFAANHGGTQTRALRPAAGSTRP